MKITFLGTGTSQGVPVIGCQCRVCQSFDSRDDRLRSSVLIENEDAKVLIDAGPDFRQQMLRGAIHHLDGILITHEHKDHIGGLDDVRALNWINKQPMDVFAEQRVIEILEKEYAYAFAEDKYPGVPQINLNKINGQVFNVKGLEIKPIRVFHYEMPILGFQIGSIAYITDANRIEEDVLASLKGVDVLVVNGLRHEKHVSHFSFSEALEVIETVNPKQGIITHISHQLGLYKEVENDLPDNVMLAYDGYVVEL